MDVLRELNRTGVASKFEPFWTPHVISESRLTLQTPCIGNGLPDRAWEELDDDADRLSDLLFGTV